MPVVNASLTLWNGVRTSILIYAFLCASVAMENAHGTNACAEHAGGISVIGGERIRCAACCTNSRQHSGGPACCRLI